LISRTPDGAFAIVPEYFEYQTTATRSYSSKFVDLFGPPRPSYEPIDVGTAEGRRFADLAASVQRVLEDTLVVWVTEFGRMPTFQKGASGRDHNPKGFTVWLAGAGGWAQLTGMEPHAALKLLLLAMLLASTAIVLAWTRSVLFAGLFQLALLLNSAALGYLDVLFLPPLLLTFWALQRERVALASFCFGLTVMTKFQPAVLAPLLLIHALGPRARPGDAAAPPARSRRPLAALLPALAVFGVTLAIFGLPLLIKLRNVTKDWFLCGGAFNLDWIATWVIRVAVPGWAGPLEPSGLCPMISEIDPLYMWPSKLLFLAAYVAILVAWWRRPKTYPNLLLFSTLAFLAAWLLSAGMHENHVYVAQVLALLLGWFDRRFVGVAAYWSLAAEVIPSPRRRTPLSIRVWSAQK